MARISKGILGGFSGTIGTVVGANWRGLDVIRSRPKPSSRPATDRQLMQQQKFKLVISFLNPLRRIQALYFGSPQGQKSRTNLATAYTINDAVEVVNDVPALNYSKVIVTKGELAAFQNLAVTPQANQVLNFTWTDNQVQASAHGNDIFCVVSYCEELNEFSNYETAAIRQDATADVTLPLLFQGKEVQVWAYFHNVEESSACISQYVGAQTVL